MAKSRRIYISSIQEYGPADGTPSAAPEFVPTAKLITFLSADSLLQVAAIKRVPLYQLVESFIEYRAA